MKQILLLAFLAALALSTYVNIPKFAGGNYLDGNYNTVGGSYNTLSKSNENFVRGNRNF